MCIYNYLLSESESKHVSCARIKCGNLGNSNKIVGPSVCVCVVKKIHARTHIRIYKNTRTFRRKANKNKTESNKYIPRYKMINYYHCAMFIANFTTDMVYIFSLNRQLFQCPSISNSLHIK